MRRREKKGDKYVQVATAKGIEGEGGIDQGDSKAAESIEEHSEEVPEKFRATRI